MKNYYLYYRLLHGLGNFQSSDIQSLRTKIQDVLSDLRNKSSEELEWTNQQTQDFFESEVTQSKRLGRVLSGREIDFDVSEEKIKIANF